MELHEVLRKRTSVRAYEQRPVPRDAIERVMESVLHAPSAGFTQGNEFLVLDAPESISRFIELTDDPLLPTRTRTAERSQPRSCSRSRTSAPTRAGTRNPTRKGSGSTIPPTGRSPTGFVDAGMASMLILLAAIDEGLATWLFEAEGERELLAEFGVPESFKLIGVIGLGYAAPAEHVEGSGKKRHRRGVADLVHYGRW